jgi:hypothetical protein
MRYELNSDLGCLAASPRAVVFETRPSKSMIAGKGTTLPSAGVQISTSDDVIIRVGRGTIRPVGFGHVNCPAS